MDIDLAIKITFYGNIKTQYKLFIFFVFKQCYDHPNQIDKQVSCRFTYSQVHLVCIATSYKIKGEKLIGSIMIQLIFRKEAGNSFFCFSPHTTFFWELVVLEDKSNPKHHDKQITSWCYRIWNEPHKCVLINRDD